jgi:class 3 adenylate cyclase
MTEIGGDGDPNSNLPVGLEPAVQTFLFADLSGFTALTEVHGTSRPPTWSAGLVWLVRRLLTAHQAVGCGKLAHPV